MTIVTLVGAITLFRASKSHFDRLELFGAAERGDGRRVRQLLASGVDPNSKDDRGISALVLAIDARSLSAVDSLVNAGADVDLAVVDGASPAHLVLDQFSEPRIIVSILSRSQDSALRARGMRQALDLAVVHNMPDCVATIDRTCVDINETLPSTACPALVYAAAHSQPELVLALIKLGANPDVVDSKGMTPLMCAARLGSVKTMGILISAGSNLTSRDHARHFTAEEWARRAPTNSAIAVALLRSVYGKGRGAK